MRTFSLTISLNHSEASIQVTWSLLTNKRLELRSRDLLRPIRGHYPDHLISNDQRLEFRSRDFWRLVCRTRDLTILDIKYLTENNRCACSPLGHGLHHPLLPLPEHVLLLLLVVGRLGEADLQPGAGPLLTVESTHRLDSLDQSEVNVVNDQPIKSQCCQWSVK